MINQAHPGIRLYLINLVFQARPPQYILNGVRSAQMDWYDLTLATYPFENVEPFPLSGIRCIRLAEDPIQLPTPDTLSIYDDQRLPRYHFFNPFQIQPAQPLLLWDATLISGDDDFDEGTLQGHVQVRVFPRNVHRQWHRNEMNVPPTYGILRPYGEILEVLRFDRDLTCDDSSDRLNTFP